METKLHTRRPSTDAALALELTAEGTMDCNGNDRGTHGRG